MSLHLKMEKRMQKMREAVEAAEPTDTAQSKEDRAETREKVVQLLMTANALLEGAPATAAKKQSAATSQSNEGLEILAVPQARAYMREKGFSSFDEVKDGSNLVHLCCIDSKTRIQS